MRFLRESSFTHDLNVILASICQPAIILESGVGFVTHIMINIVYQQFVIRIQMPNNIDR